MTENANLNKMHEPASLQSEKPGDAQITADIRKRIAEAIKPADATSVKIVTRNGSVTLSGPVKTQDEREKIERLAAGVAGASNVKDQLVISAR